jgi:hypothetical protein
MAIRCSAEQMAIWAGQTHLIIMLIELASTSRAHRIVAEGTIAQPMQEYRPFKLSTQRNSSSRIFVVTRHAGDLPALEVGLCL